MANTIVEYLTEKTASFSEEPLNDVDSLVLSTIAYFEFEKGQLGHVIPSELVALPMVLCGIARKDLLSVNWLKRMGGEEFLLALLESPRFMELRAGYYVNEVSGHFEKQFSAISFFLPEGSVYVAFRGTDNSLAGWKEDFNITFMSEIPSQISARTYLEDMADVATTWAKSGGRADSAVPQLYVGGHSKGGNLAEYAALTCREVTFEKVARIYNHDGPGFAFEPSERIRGAAYAAKLKKTVPESSVFGMLMETRNCYEIVKADGFLFAQHAATHWNVEGDAFVAANALSPEASIVFETMNKWALTYEPDQRELLIDTIYELFTATNVERWSDMGSNVPATTFAILEATAKVPPEMRSTIMSMLRDMATILGGEAVKHALANMPSPRPKLEG